MDIRYKLFPYPVLAYFSDDYKDSSFEATIDFSKEGYDLKIHFASVLKNAQLSELMAQGKVEFVYHLECSQTGFRKVIRTTKITEEYTLSSKDVRGKLQICPFIVANENISDYTNDSFHHDYAGLKFNIEAGCVMAVGKQVNAEISKDVDDLSNVPSIFSIIINLDTTVKHMLVDIEKTKIIIQLPTDIFYNFKALNANVYMQPVLNSLVIIPALVYVLEEVKNRPADERYMLEEYGWYRTIRKVLSSEFSCDIGTEEFNSQNMMEVAQRLINCPLNDAMHFLSSASDAGEEN